MDRPPRDERLRGDPQRYHDWEFRTRLRIRLYEEGQRPKWSDAGSKEAASPLISEGPKQEDQSPISPGKESEDRSVLVNRVLEGLRGEAFEIARDLGLDALTTDGALSRHPRAQEGS